MKPAAKPGTCIYIVGGDAATSNELSAILRPQGFDVSGFATGGACLAAIGQRKPACILLDAHLPDGSARDLIMDVRRRRCAAPVCIVCTTAADRAMFAGIRVGKIDFMEKPFDPVILVGRVREAIAGAKRRPTSPPAPCTVAHHFAGCEMLTPREHEVLALVASGASNKEAGRRLGISPRTVEVHRARILEKLGARNTVELVHRVLSERD